MFTLLRGSNQNFQHVDRRNNNLKEIPDDILVSKSLEELLLDSNHIRVLPKGLFRMSKIRKLTLSENEIFKLQPEIGNLTSLVEIDISKNDIYDIPENIKSLKQLQIADFSSNPLKKVPISIVHLQNLTDLKLNDVTLTELPSDFGRLVNLQTLELRDNVLKQLPSSFVSLKKLECIDLANNMFDEMPPCLCQLITLRELWLDSNEISSLLSDIKKLKNLKCLDISENELEFLPEEISGLESLTDLYVSQNWLQLLPNGIGNLTELTVFKVDNNKLLSLPMSLGKCNKLQELVLKENDLSSLPTSIGHLINLKTLIADCNKLSTLPVELCNLTKLTLLSLRDNCLYYVPEDIGVLEELQVLDLCGNRIQYLPASVTLLNLKALWLSENQHKPILKLQRDFDWKIQRDILTCYMLPQQESSVNYSVTPTSDHFDEKKFYFKQSHVDFIVENDDLEKNMELVRHATPYPKDLKSKAIKLLPLKYKNLKTEESAIIGQSPKTNFLKFYEENATVHCVSPVADSGVSSAASPINTTTEKIIYDDFKKLDENALSISKSIEKLKTENSSLSLNEQDEILNENCLSFVKANASFESECILDSQELNKIEDTDYDIFNIYIQREPSGLGLSIAGGKESTPYKGNDEGIFVSKITKGGPADQSGLKLDDKILKVNDIVLLGIEHFTAVEILKKAGKTIKFTILREKIGTLNSSCNVSSNHQISSTFGHENSVQNHASSDVQIRSNNDGFRNNNFKISYKPLNDTHNYSNESNDSQNSSTKDNVSLYMLHQKNRIPLFEPDMTSTPMSLSRASSKNIPDVIQPSTLDSLVHDTAYDTKEKYSSPIVKVTIQNSRPYTPLSPNFPPASKALGETSETLTRSSYSETTLMRMTSNSSSSKLPAMEEVILKRIHGSLGLSIWGGRDQICFPFGEGKFGIFISRIALNGIASRTNKLKIGDRILKVNDIDISNASHAEAVNALCVPGDEIKLLIQHDRLPEGWQEIILQRMEDENLGVEFGGGLFGLNVNPYDYYDEGVFIIKIHSNSTAGKDGRLKVGMRVIEVCNVSLLGANLEEANQALQNNNKNVAFIICNGFNLPLPLNISYTCLPGSSSATIESVPCIDSDDESIEAFHPQNQQIAIPDCKTVDEKVLDVVRAAECLVSPSPRVFLNPPSSLRKTRTTTVLLSKHVIHPSVEIIDQDQFVKPSYLPCEV